MLRSALTEDMALDNWRRVRNLFGWFGWAESDEALLRRIARLARDAPHSALKRAQLGHRQGAGRLRRSSARKLVGPLLGVELGAHDELVARSAARVPTSLRAASDEALRQLAEHWVDYLCRDRDDPPASDHALCRSQRRDLSH